MSAPGDEACSRVRDATVAEHLLRELAPQVLGAVVRRFGDFAAAEDAVQEALLAAAAAVAARGRARQPARLADPRRRAADDRSAPQRAGAPAPRDRRLLHERRRSGAPDSRRRATLPIRTTRLILLFMCCHPALTPPSAIALTLRAVGGLTTAEIAHAFLVPEATMAQRISRAKQRDQDVRACRSACRRATSAPSGSAPCCTCST